MKSSWPIACITGVVAVACIWGLSRRHSTQQPTPPHRVWEFASSAGSRFSSDTSTTNQPDTADNAALAAETHSRGTTTRFSPAVERLLREGHKAPRPSEIKSLTPAEQAALVNAYRQIPEITNKLGIAWTLAYAGDAQVGELLWWSLTQEYAGREFTGLREPTQLITLVVFLGLVAARDDLTYRRLEQGLNPEFWLTNITWTPPPWLPKRTEALSERLSFGAIKALVLSGRPEGWPTVLNLASNPPPWFGEAHASAIVGAAYAHEMITQHGKEWFWENCPGDVNRLMNWTESDQGRPWYEWEQRFTRTNPREAP